MMKQIKAFRIGCLYKDSHKPLELIFTSALDLGDYKQYHLRILVYSKRNISQIIFYGEFLGCLFSHCKTPGHIVTSSHRKTSPDNPVQFTTCSDLDHCSP